MKNRPVSLGRGTVAAASAALALIASPARAVAPAVNPADAERIIGPLHTVLDKVPQGVPSRASVDAPLLGNGSFGAVVTGKPEAWPLQFWMMKGSFCKIRHDHRKGGPRPFGGLNIEIPALKDGEWHLEQHIHPAITTGRFRKDGLTVNLRAFLAATADVMIIELTAEGAPADSRLTLWPDTGRGSVEEKGETDGILWAKRTFAKNQPQGGTHPAEIETSAGVAVRVLAGNATRLEPGKPLTLAVTMQSSFDAQAPLEAAVKMARELTPASVKSLEDAHRQWWRSFWTQSLVEIDSPLVQQAYYMANYEQGCGMRDKNFPPGLFGLWVTHDDPCWAGDYHLNFDYQSQFYSLYKNNRIEQADTFEQPVLDFIDRGRWYAQNVLGIRGVYYPVGIFVKGMETSRQPTSNKPGVEKGGVFLGQKTNAAYCLVPISMRWWHTYDTEYGRKVYPFVVEVANFWEDYLVFKDGRYVVTADSSHESIHTGGDADINSPLSLGLIHNAFTLALDMSKELGLDAARREKWQHILTNLSKFPTFQKDGKTVFRYSEKGTEWVPDNSVGTQHIYPAGAIGLDDTELAEIGRNTIKAKSRWNCDNGVNSFYPAAVRVGYDPNEILRQLETLFFRNSARTDSQLPRNLEEGSTVPNTIHEMLCMSHRQVLRPFAVWPKDKDASFRNLRAEGAFLVSSTLKGGNVGFVRIFSEKGRDCTFVNPWPGKPVDAYRNGQKTDTLQGERITTKTTAGETLLLVPAGAPCPTEG